MSRLCRLKSYKDIGDDGMWAYDEIIRLRNYIKEIYNLRPFGKGSNDYTMNVEDLCRKALDNEETK